MRLRGALLCLWALLTCGPVWADSAYLWDSSVFAGTPAVQAPQAVALRSTYPANLAPANITVGGTYRQYYEIAARGPVWYLQVCYQNVQSTGTSEADGPGPMTGLTSSLEIGPTANGPFPLSAIKSDPAFTFNGGVRPLPNLGVAGEEIWSDKLWLRTPLLPGQGIYVRTFAPPGRSYAAYQGLNGSLTEYANNGSFIAAVTGLLGDGATTTFSGTIDTAHTTGAAGTNIVLPLRPNMIQVVTGGITAVDDGAGNLNGSGVTGTLNYTTGAFTETFAVAPPLNTAFVANGISAANIVPPDDTLVPQPSGFHSAGYGGWLPTVIPTVAPCGIIGGVDAASPPQHTLVLIGDSILSGIGNNIENKTYAEYMSNSLGVIRLGQGGDRAHDFATTEGSFRRMITFAKVAGPGARVLTNYGSNDITQFQPLATIKTDLLAVWAKLAADLPNGFADITQALITPYTTSASVNVPVNNTLYGPGTVASGNPSVRNALNAWICTQAGVTIGAVLDVNLALEAHPDSCNGAGDGTWASSLDTLDGRHTSNLGQKTILPAMFSPTGTNPHPVFAP